MSARLFSPLSLGPYTLAHRVIMAPLTRMRATRPSHAANALNAEYYAQRASKGGLLIAEASQVSLQGQGYPATPGIHSDAQVAGWKLVTDAVHAKGGLIYLQLWHVGRVGHSSHRADHSLPVAPSALAPAGKVMKADFSAVEFETPRALETAEVAGIIDQFRDAAKRAKAAGFDGVEVHGANGYVLEQFLLTQTNKRTDEWGGSIENRARLLLAVTAAVAEVWGADRTGVRLSPYGIANDTNDDDPMPLFTYVVQELGRQNLSYLHLIEPRASGAGGKDGIREDQPSAAKLFRPLWKNVLITAGGFDGPGAKAAVEAGDADAIAFGRLFISNPDLPERIRLDAEFTPYVRRTFYGGDAAGYTDYPTLAEQRSAAE